MSCKSSLSLSRFSLRSVSFWSFVASSIAFIMFSRKSLFSWSCLSLISSFILSRASFIFCWSLLSSASASSLVSSFFLSSSIISWFACWSSSLRNSSRTSWSVFSCSSCSFSRSSTMSSIFAISSSRSFIINFLVSFIFWYLTCVVSVGLIFSSRSSTMRLSIALKSSFTAASFIIWRKSAIRVSIIACSSSLIGSSTPRTGTTIRSKTERSIATQDITVFFGNFIFNCLMLSPERRSIVSSLWTFATYDLSFWNSTIVVTRSSSPSESILFARRFVFERNLLW